MSGPGVTGVSALPLALDQLCDAEARGSAERQKIYAGIAASLLNEDGIDVNMIRPNYGAIQGWLPWAVEGGHMSVFEMFLQHKDIDVNKWCPLHLAIKEMRTGDHYVRALLQHKDINVNLLEDTNTPLGLAVKYGKKEVGPSPYHRHHHCTSIAPSLHHHHTITAPSLYHPCA